MVSLKYKCSSCYNSFFWLLYCLQQMTLTAFILIYLAIDIQKHPHDRKIILQEIFISFLIFIDIVISRLVVGTHIHKDPLWWFDILCFISITIGLCLYGRKLNLTEEDIDLSFLIFRYALQLARLILYFIKVGRAIWKSTTNKVIFINEKASRNDSSNSVSQMSVNISQFSPSKTNDITISRNKTPKQSQTPRSVGINCVTELSAIKDYKSTIQEPFAKI